MTQPVVRVGVLGGGQLGQMLALAAVPLGMQVFCLERTADCPAALVCPVVVGDPDSEADVVAFAGSVDVLTYETESVAVGPLRSVGVPVYPGLPSLAGAQDRWVEKQLFADCGVPAAATVPASTEAELRHALTDLPRLVKTRTGGYDGKGQVRVGAPADVERAVALLAETPSGVVVEELVPFDREVSILGARGLDGAVATWWLTENEHRDGILRVSRPIQEPKLQERAERMLRALLAELDHVGVLALELFVAGDRLLANEMAPRVHNSGHWTIEGSTTSQFEQHLRAITGLPLGMPGTSYVRSAMVNLIGGLPAVPAVAAVAGAHLHLYGKSPRAARKLGHVTLTAARDEDLSARLAALRDLAAAAARG